MIKKKKDDKYHSVNWQKRGQQQQHLVWLDSFGMGFWEIFCTCGHNKSKSRPLERNITFVSPTQQLVSVIKYNTVDKWC